MSNARAMAAVEQAAYDLLAAAVTGAAVYADVPEDADPPVVIIGDISSEPAGGKGDGEFEVQLSVVTVIAATERRPGFAIQEQIEAAVGGDAGAVVEQDGFSLQFFHERADMVLAEDGEGYIGTSTLRIAVEPIG